MSTHFRTRQIVKEKKPRNKKASPSPSGRAGEGSPKAEKQDTKMETFKLYKEGNTIEAIAKLRTLTATTIEGHLAHFIAKGKLEASEFLPAEKIANIIAVSKTLNTFQFGIIKQSLGDEYSYGEIKMALASYLSEQSDTEKSR